MKTLALLDLDIYAFRAGFSCESKALDEHGQEVKVVAPVEIAYARLTEMLDNTLRELGTKDYQGFLTDSHGNFRKQVDESYKANRKDVARPIHLPALEEYLIKEWGAVRAVGEEADDRLGIVQTSILATTKDEPIIVTIDKDLNMIPGQHYNFVKCELYSVNEDEALFNFYKQLMMGDSTDNIAGCPGIGPKKAEKALLPAFGNELEMVGVVYETYKKCYPELCADELEELITVVGRLIWIRRQEGEMWSIPTL